MKNCKSHINSSYCLIKYSRKLTFPKFIFLAVLFLSQVLLSQSENISSYQYISPIPGSSFISPETNIIIRYGSIIVDLELEASIINVSGTRSGFHHGQLIAAKDNRTLIFKPSNPFYPGEKVSISFAGGLRTNDGKFLPRLEFSFYVSNQITVTDAIENRDYLSGCLIRFNSGDELKNFNYSAICDTGLPADLPNVHISISNKPADGCTFIAPWYFQGSFFDPNYLMIVDNHGTPVYYKKNDVLALDFKVHKNGILTYYDQGSDSFIAMDSSYNLINRFNCGNGYPTDFHDIQLIPNGNYLIMGQDFQTVRMDTIVPGGDTAAVVIGQIIQEKDANHNVIFQWRSWDHFLITDASEHINLTAHTIDYVHANSIELDYDENIIISCRNMDEVTKISRSTGEIIWRMGGKKNQFQFSNHPRGFSFQHDVRRLKDGNITIFDNGIFLIPQYTSILEYSLNELDKILSLDWSFSDGNHYSAAMGNSQRLDNGRTFIGWGSSWNPAATEVEYDGTKTFELKFDSLFYSYRAFRFPWRTNLITADNYRVDFEYIPVNLSGRREIVVRNNSNTQLEIASYYSRTSSFSVINNFPIVIDPFESRIVQIKFSPDSLAFFSDDIHLRIQRENEMIAQVIKVIGYSVPTASTKLEDNYLIQFELQQNYPNPFNPTTNIKYQIPELSFVTLKVYDVLGNKVATLVNEEKPSGSYEVEFSANSHSGEVRNLPAGRQGLTSGIYFYRLQAGDFVETKKMILIK